MIKRDHSVEVIEDSEPERQRQREAFYARRREDRAGKGHIPAQDDSPIIEISDDESLYGSRQPTIVEISDDSAPSHSPPLSTLSQVKPVLPLKSSSIRGSESQLRCEHSNQITSNASTATTTTNKGIPLPSQSTSPESRALDLGRFSFISSRLSRTSASSSSINISNHQPTPPTRITSNNVQRFHVSDYSFTDSQLQKLTRKLNHIQKCARKNSTTEEAVRLMIEQDLQALAIKGDPNKGKGKPLAPVPEPATLLEAVVADTTTKPKGRKKGMPTTVLQVAETHQAIYSRAKTLFEESVTPCFPATQGFAPSKLGRHNQTQPEATQSFPKSRLGTNRRVPGFGDSEDEVSGSHSPSPALSLSPLPPRSPSPQNTVLSRTSTPPSERYSAKGRHRTLRGELRQSLSLQSGMEDQLQSELDCSFGDTPSDIADSHRNSGVIEWAGAGAEGKTSSTLWPSKPFSPCVPAIKSASPSPRQLYPGPNILSTNLPTQSSLPLPFGRPISPRRRSPARKKRPGKAKIAKGRASPGVAAADDDLFEVIILTAIKANTELYYKVLRYEPVDFNVFLDLAIGQDLPTKKLVYKLRAFLDRQTIHFYGPIKNGP